MKGFEADTQVSAIDASLGSELIGDPEGISDRDGKAKVSVALGVSYRDICWSQRR